MALKTAAPHLAVSAGKPLYIDLLKRCLSGYLYPESSNIEIYPHRGMGVGRKMLVRALNKRGYKLFKAVPFDCKARECGADWPSIAYSMVGCKRLDNIQMCVERALQENTPGDFIETGVWRGGACMLMRAILKLYGITNRDVWLADSFEGLPTPSLSPDRGYDLSQNLYMRASLEEVVDNFRRFELLDQQVKFLKGWFKDTLPTAPISRLAVLRTDGDLYESTMDVLTFLYDKVSAGGFIIIDDYFDWPPCKRAVDEFRATKRIIDPIQDIDGHGIFWQKA